MSEFEIPGEERNRIHNIATAIRDGSCIPFLGAGVSTAFRDWTNGHAEVEGCPSGQQLKDIILSDLSLDPHPHPELEKVSLENLQTVAEFYNYANNGQRYKLEDRVRVEITKARGPRPIHWALAHIPSIRCVFTTNYDRLMEEACAHAITNRKLIGPYVYDQSKQRQATPDVPIEIATSQRFLEDHSIERGLPLVLYKMHGCITVPDSLLITTTDYVRYIVTWRDDRRGMPKTFRDMMLRNTMLFLGYGFNDFNLRVIWESMISSFPGGRFPIQSYAIKTPVTEFERELWARRNITLIDCDVTTFAREIAHAFDFVIPSFHGTRGDSVKGDGGGAR